MRSNYVDVATRSILTLDGTLVPRGDWAITRVSVLPHARGLGIASRLLDECCDDADREGVVLWLQIVPDHTAGSLPRETLEAWYRRRGFQRVPEEQAPFVGGAWWRREPSAGD